MRKKTYAFVVYDDDEITGLICVDCKTDNDFDVVPIRDQGSVKCDRCGKVA